MNNNEYAVQSSFFYFTHLSFAFPFLFPGSVMLHGDCVGFTVELALNLNSRYWHPVFVQDSLCLVPADKALNTVPVAFKRIISRTITETN